MKRWLELCLAPFVHSILSFAFLSILVSEPDGAVMGYLFMFLIIVNCAITAFTANAKWYAAISNVFLFIVFFVLIVVMYNSYGPNPNVEEENYGDGILLLVVGLPAIAASLVVGTVLGILFSYVYRENIKAVKEKLAKRFAD